MTGTAAPASTLRRALGLWQVTLAGIGVILGAGVYALVGPAAAQAGDALWLAFVLAGATAGLTAYSYARLGTMRPKNSPEFQYTTLAFGRQVGFIAGWLMLAADLLAAATVAIGFGGYLTHLAGTPPVPNALALLAIVGAVIYAGIAESVGLAIALTIVEAAGLLFVVVVGLPFWAQSDFLQMPRGVTGVWSAASLIFFAYLGFDELGNFAEEMRRPERDLPRALFVSMIASTLIYVLVALSATGAVGWQALAASEAPLALVAGRALGARADTAISVIALAATANTVLLLLVAASRSIYGMAAAGVLPGVLSHVGRTATPVAAAAVALGATGALVFLGSLARVAALTNAAVLLSFILVNLSLPWLAWRRITGSSIGRRAADLLVPLVATVLCGWLLLHTGWLSIAAAAAVAALGLFMGAGLRRQPAEGG